MIENKIQNWKYKLLSQAGRITMIKSVLMALPLYVMSFYKIPMKIFKKIQQLIKIFWINQSPNIQKRCLHWDSWETLCYKKQDGGLGIRDLKLVNQVLLAKTGWHILMEPYSLPHQILKAKYFDTKSFCEVVQKGQKDSYVWSSILWGKDLLLKGMGWRVGNGENIKVRGHNRIPSNSNFKPFFNNSSKYPSLSVSQLIDQNSRTWNMELLQDVCHEFIWYCKNYKDQAHEGDIRR